MKRLVLQLARERGPKAEDVAIPVDTTPGEIAQVDFGFAGLAYDPKTRKKRRGWLFVMVLGCSRHMFCKVVFDQSTDTWITLHVDAFCFFGGVPKVVVPDNLKAAVIRAAFGVDDDVTVNRGFRELARHHGFVIDPTPPRSPEKKGKVERSVQYVKDSFLAARRRARTSTTRTFQKAVGTCVIATVATGKRAPMRSTSRPWACSCAPSWTRTTCCVRFAGPRRCFGSWRPSRASGLSALARAPRSTSVVGQRRPVLSTEERTGSAHSSARPTRSSRSTPAAWTRECRCYFFGSAFERFPPDGLSVPFFVGQPPASPCPSSAS